MIYFVRGDDRVTIATARHFGCWRRALSMRSGTPMSKLPKIDRDNVREATGGPEEARALRKRFGFGDAWSGELTPELLDHVSLCTSPWSGGDARALGIDPPRWMQDAPVPCTSGLGSRLRRTDR